MTPIASPCRRPPTALQRRWRPSSVLFLAPASAVASPSEDASSSAPTRSAGEWGHNPLPWPAPGEIPGPPCYCGRSGCLETFLSGPALAADHRHRTGEGLSPPQIARAAKSGDPACGATLGRYVHRLVRGLASVINMIDP